MNVNELIDFNLNLLKDGSDIRPLELKDTDNNILEDNNSLALFNKLISESLVITNQFKRILLSARGHEILSNGGWLIHLEKEKIKAEKAESKDALEFELKTLQKESLEYQKKIREQTDRIRNLEEQIKFISLIKLYWWFIPICITIGVFLKEFWEIIQQTK